VKAGAALVSDRGDRVALDVHQWRREADEVDHEALAPLVGPVLDIGCGPGRIVEALACTGRVALGVDSSSLATGEAGRRGVAAITRSVFEPLPGEQRWQSVVLFDGNIGIGGDPDALLRRAHQLLAPGGVALVEVGAPGTPTDRLRVRLERDGRRGMWFPWARLSADRVGDAFRSAGFRVRSCDERQGRWFATAVCAKP